MRYGQPNISVCFVQQQRPWHRHLRPFVQLPREPALLVELPAVFAPVFGIVGPLHPMWCAAQHEFAFAGGEKNILSEQSRRRRCRTQEVPNACAFACRRELRSADHA
jgi:hypothetical protein